MLRPDGPHRRLRRHLPHRPYRSTRDIDLALATPLTDEEFEGLGYRIFNESGKKRDRTREGVKLDLRTRDVSGIPVSDVFFGGRETGRVKRDTGHAPGGVSDRKMRASRPQDVEDVQTLCRRHGRPYVGASSTRRRHPWSRRS